MKRQSRRAVLAGTIAIAAAGTARAEEPLKLVLGFPPGASSDTLTRLIADKMRVSLGRTVVVENKPGAVGIVANLAVKSAPPDGNTLLMTPLAPMVAFPHSYSKLDYDPFKDYVPVAELCAFYLAMGVGSAVPAKTLAEYAALVRTGGTYANFASAAAGSLPHFFGLMFAKAAGVQLTHVPYKGTANVMQAMMSGEIPAAVLTVADWGTLQQSGKGRMLAVSSPQRLAQYPDVPTFKESGYAIEGSAWYGLFAPAGTPQPIVDKLAADAVDAVRQPDVRQKLEPLGLDVTGLGSTDMAKILRDDYDRWGPVIRASGFKAD
ncbi:MAG TPA: tripartite tricarboxylate transporter substrate-binding protein [Reyranella sp.]|jgi:tripartite-type tricarboxylate transporter receptor subunit TctC|nr:tripartite tricarboxylate transporter substrate-binding protein [Reyranella sp.]